MADKLNKFVCTEETFFQNRHWVPGSKKLMYSEKTKVPHFKNISGMGKEEKSMYETGDKLEQIRLFLISMDPNDDEQWTRDGLPQVRFVEKSMNIDTNRGEISKAFSGFTRDSDISTMAGKVPDAFLQ